MPGNYTHINIFVYVVLGASLVSLQLSDSVLTMFVTLPCVSKLNIGHYVISTHAQGEDSEKGKNNGTRWMTSFMSLYQANIWKGKTPTLKIRKMNFWFWTKKVIFPNITSVLPKTLQSFFSFVLLHWRSLSSLKVQLFFFEAQWLCSWFSLS